MADDRGTPANWDDVITGIATKYQVDPRLARAVAMTESSLNPAAVSPTGARGIMQLMPETMARHNVNPDDPADNIRGGIEELRDLIARNNGDVVMALRHYNASPQAPTSVTDPYVQKVLGQLKPASAPAPARRPGAVAVPPPASPQVGEPPPKGFDEQHPYLAQLGDILTDAPNVGSAPMDPRAALARTAVRYGRQALSALDPKKLWAGAKALYQGPGAMGQAVGEATGEHLREAGKRFVQGDVGAANQELVSAIPVVGERLKQSADYANAGQWPEMAGALTDVGLQAFGPELMEGRLARPLFRPRLTPEEAAAVALGHREGVFVDAPTASGSTLARNLERTSGATLPGSRISRNRRLLQGQQLEATGERLAGRVSPVPTSPELAGRGIQHGIEDYIVDRHTDMRGHYQNFEQVATDPANTVQVQVGTRPGTGFMGMPGGTPVPVMQAMQLPVDLRQIKGALRPMLDEALHRMPVGQQQLSPGLQALQNLVTGPDYAPAVSLEKDLGAIKSLGRGAELPQLRDASQGMAAQATQLLQDAIDHTVGQAHSPSGINALDELQMGRSEASAKRAAEEIFERLRVEPVGAFKQATMGQDLGIQHLRELQAHAPQAMPALGRAVLEHLFVKSRAGSGEWLSGATGAAGEWNKLGDATKDLLYGANRADLDSFFLLAKKIAENPNPSGSAITGLTGVSAYNLFPHPYATIAGQSLGGVISLLMNTPGGVRLLTQGLTIPARGARAVAWTGAVMNRLDDYAKRAEAIRATPPPPPVGTAPFPRTPPRVSTPPPPR
jgi:hypothetical protein